MRRLLIGMAFTFCLSLTSTEARAQFGDGFGDPFMLYYGFYLPHQAAIAAQPTPTDTINAVVAERQRYQVTDRSGLYDPASPFGDTEELDPLRPYSAKRGGERLSRPSAPGLTSNIRGAGPALYYNRTARYFPTLRGGRNPNRNLSVPGRRGGGGFGAGVSPY